MHVRLTLVGSLLVAVGCGVPVFEPEPPGSLMTGVSSDAGATSDAGAPVDAGVTVDAGTSVDAGTGTNVDAGVVRDAGVPTYERDAKPIFMRNCTRCHEAGNSGLASFADRYDVLRTASTVCRGQTVGTCIGWVLADQGMEGGGCRTWEVRSFHRAGFPCVSAQDIAIVQAWIAAGMPQR